MNEILITKRRDLRELHSTIHGIIGRKCWKVAFVYPGELFLHFGRHISYGNRKMSGKRTGQWRLGTRATPWTLFTPGGLICSKERDEEAVEKKMKVLEGRKVTKFSVSVPNHDLSIAFGKDYLFWVTPTGNQFSSALPYWELFMPNHQLVVFGPGDSWSCRPSNVPLRQSAGCQAGIGTLS